MRRLPVTAFVALSTALAFSAANSSKAQPAGPHRPAGLWQSVMAMPNGMAMTVKTCTDAAMEARRSPLNSAQNRGAADCSQSDVHPIPGGFFAKSVCKTPQGEMTSEVTATGDFQHAYSLHIVSHMAGRAQDMTMTLRYLGACPAGMQPGQVTMPNGMTMGGARPPAQ